MANWNLRVERAAPADVKAHVAAADLPELPKAALLALVGSLDAEPALSLSGYGGDTSLTASVDFKRPEPGA